ncbi:alternative oxidase-domain containing protein [Nitzschia inconspicua]|uniref:Alternative oxidase-domain containing protein n=1 Tax=Nitzschia inconspicua TaxID=303405 RepID=A0A9K3KCX3_9STRA|nr:alternative oxidase-domain containing protein [Nitzschia inconspicua]
MLRIRYSIPLCLVLTGHFVSSLFIPSIPTSRQANAFSIATQTSPTRSFPLNMASAPTQDDGLMEAAVDVMDSVNSSPSGSLASKTLPVLPTPKGMDQGVYTLNKVLIDTVYSMICFLYPVTGTERDFARFYVLETVARVPYFAYLSVLHLRETFGERYQGMSERMRTHYAEADNELHHLLIMESLGGNQNPLDRFVAQSAAFVYYWYVIAIFTFNESAAYHLSELIEDHAYNTYNKFLTEHADNLKSKPVPEIARKYYERDNPFLFDLFCTVKSKAGNDRARPLQLDTLHDVFVNIRDDEREHWRTLTNLVQYNDMNAVDASLVRSTKPVEAVSSLQ